MVSVFIVQCQTTLVAAESKREEEKAKGVSTENGAENPDIVPFEDNEEEEEEEESEEEDESIGQAPGLGTQGRGRGRGMMWPPNFPMGRGIRPMPGMRGFLPGMMGADGFSYGPGPGPDGFPLPDPFGMGPRPFVPYGPRFSSDFTGPAPGMMFPGRPSQPGGVLPGGGFGMMMGPGRAPFMPGGMGMGGRGGRPMGMPPIFPPQPGLPQGGNRGPKRDMRGSSNDWGETFGSGSEQGKVQDMSGGRGDEPQGQQGTEKFVPKNNLTNDESESEDEAPRRSRHGEGKKKRRSLDDDVHVDP